MARYLLDSHVFLWYDQSTGQLSAADRRRLDDRSNELFLSVASVWELTIKRSLRRLTYAGSFSEAARAQGVSVLPILTEHAEAVEFLPRHHGDPFDHLLVAQARVEGLVLVTHDEKMMAYNVPMLRV